jgi:hypothetical protein
MGCWHRWHGCGPWCGPPYGGWYGPEDWYEPDLPVRRRHRRYRPVDRETAVDELEARLEELLAAVRGVEAELAELRGPAATAAGE